MKSVSIFTKNFHKSITQINFILHAKHILRENQHFGTYHMHTYIQNPQLSFGYYYFLFWKSWIDPCSKSYNYKPLLL